MVSQRKWKGLLFFHRNGFSRAGLLTGSAAVAVLSIRQRGHVFGVQLEALVRAFVYTDAATGAFLAIYLRFFSQSISPPFVEGAGKNPAARSV